MVSSLRRQGLWLAGGSCLEISLVGLYLVFVLTRPTIAQMVVFFGSSCLLVMGTILSFVAII